MEKNDKRVSGIETVKALDLYRRNYDHYVETGSFPATTRFKMVCIEKDSIYRIKARSTNLWWIEDCEYYGTAEECWLQAFAILLEFYYLQPSGLTQVDKMQIVLKKYPV